MFCMPERQTKDMSREWRIRFTKISGSNSADLEDFSVPMHKFDRTQLQTLAIALFAKHSGSSAESLVAHVANGRRSKLVRNGAWDLQYFCDPDSKRSGFYCMDYSLYLTVECPISDDVAAAVKRIQQENLESIDV